MNAKGPVFKYGDNIDTDVIIPARYLNTQSPAELAAHCMEDIDKTFITRVKAGDIMVGGWNFGCGSSREHAPLVIKTCGTGCVIAKSFARIHAANLINAGILPMTFANPDDYDALKQDAKLTISDIVSGMEAGVLTVRADNDFTFQVTCNLTARQRKILLAGGLLNYTKEGGQ